ncbi:MAG TPA: hypothetical protein VLG12_05600 [Candidatus Saccharimonadales bacterium]|nr:hypothetical protein [Candidatus Saccharimonadales bacterium]
MEQNNISTYLLIDTCVIQLAGKSDKNRSEAIIRCLAELGKEYKLAISEFTVYENLHGLPGKKIREAVEVLNPLERKTVSSKVLLLSSMLGTLYHDENYDYIQAGDKIIASTTILEKGLVLTYNHRDFPPPFFLTKKSLSIEYKKKHYIQHLDLAIYEPNLNLLARRLLELQKR